MLDFILCIITPTYRILYLTSQCPRAVSILMLVIGDEQRICIFNADSKLLICRQLPECWLIQQARCVCYLAHAQCLRQANKIEPVVYPVFVTVTHEQKCCLRSFNYRWASHNAYMVMVLSSLAAVLACIITMLHTNRCLGAIVCDTCCC